MNIRATVFYGEKRLEPEPATLTLLPGGMAELSTPYGKMYGRESDIRECCLKFMDYRPLTVVNQRRWWRLWT